ncbi:unnamed protein product [marine sediment metagenome]|uniref:Uncharacterized protein n=1 Tax=marine sediment metagenome TaxID=412755 RepID=X1C8E6_9ZZZZ
MIVPAEDWDRHQAIWLSGPDRKKDKKIRFAESRGLSVEEIDAEPQRMDSMSGKSMDSI